MSSQGSSWQEFGEVEPVTTFSDVIETCLFLLRGGAAPDPRAPSIQGDEAFDDDISVSLLEVDLGGSTSARAA